MNMIEKVARAINKCDEDDLLLQSTINNMARAAILAMREPSEKMIDAGQLTFLDTIETSGDCYCAMIDAALKE